MLAPRIETERLILRTYRLEDFAVYAAMWADPRVTRHIADGAPRSREEAWKSFLSMAGHWLLLGYGNWAVEEQASGNYVGGIGWGERKRDRGTEFAGMPELGYTFVAGAQGKGYATEAVRAVMDWGSAHFGSRRVLAVIAPDNIASCRVVEKCGFRETARQDSAGRMRLFYEAVLSGERVSA
jgi:RimJ/RimL family protein N-acetyltransferase